MATILDRSSRLATFEGDWRDAHQGSFLIPWTESFVRSIRSFVITKRPRSGGFRHFFRNRISSSWEIRGGQIAHISRAGRGLRRAVSDGARIPNPPGSNHGEVLFIDGLDERRGGRQDRDTVDALAAKLIEAEPAMVRISCRVADGLGIVTSSRWSRFSKSAAAWSYWSWRRSRQMSALRC